MQDTHKTFTDYVDSLSWDGTPRLDRWLIDYAGAEDTPYVRAASRMLFVAAVRRARQPGCRFDQMLVIDGPQGCGKSSALRLLAVEDAWFTDDVAVVAEDASRVIEATSGKWIVEVSELSGMGRSDMDALKTFLSRTHDEARLAYQKMASRVARSFVVVGTTCETSYFVNYVGSRRLVPVHVRRFDLERLRVVRDQLWAEAVVAEAAGESIYVATPGTP